MRSVRTGSGAEQRPGGAIVSEEGHRVTTLELFFDLAFVFAFTQLSRLMAQQHDALGILQALVILALLWWSWTAYGWLANLAHADAGIVRIVMIVGMTATFVCGLVVLEVYDDPPGGLFAPMVFVAAYLVARFAHAVVFVWLTEPSLRRRTIVTMSLSVIPTGALLTVGALLGPAWQLWCWLAAVAIEPIVSYRSSVGVAWPVHSTVHFAERHGLVVILALGESILAIGVGVASEPISSPILIGVLLSMLVCVALWWAYFSRLAGKAEHALARRDPAARARVATDGYTYLHLALVAGIVVVALGLEVAMAHIEESEPFGFFGAAALCGGAACYLAGTAFFARRVIGEWAVIRLVGAGAFLVTILPLVILTPIAALAVAGAELILLLVLEAWLARRRRGRSDPTSTLTAASASPFIGNA